MLEVAVQCVLGVRGGGCENEGSHWVSMHVEAGSEVMFSYIHEVNRSEGVR